MDRHEGTGQVAEADGFETCLAEFDRLMNEDDPAPAQHVWALLKEIVAHDMARAQCASVGMVAGGARD